MLRLTINLRTSRWLCNNYPRRHLIDLIWLDQNRVILWNGWKNMITMSFFWSGHCEHFIWIFIIRVFSTCRLFLLFHRLVFKVDYWAIILFRLIIFWTLCVWEVFPIIIRITMPIEERCSLWWVAAPPWLIPIRQLWHCLKHCLLLFIRLRMQILIRTWFHFIHLF